MVQEDSEVTHNIRTDDEGRDWLELENVDLGAAGMYKCNYEYPDGQVFSMRFDIRVNTSLRPQGGVPVKIFVIHDFHIWDSVFRELSRDELLLC